MLLSHCILAPSGVYRAWGARRSLVNHSNPSNCALLPATRGNVARHVVHAIIADQAVAADEKTETMMFPSSYYDGDGRLMLKNLTRSQLIEYCIAAGVWALDDVCKQDGVVVCTVIQVSRKSVHCSCGAGCTTMGVGCAVWMKQPHSKMALGRDFGMLWVLWLLLPLRHQCVWYTHTKWAMGSIVYIYSTITHLNMAHASPGRHSTLVLLWMVGCSCVLLQLQQIAHGVYGFVHGCIHRCMR